MILNPLPYSLRWAAKLLRRDIRTLKTTVATKIKARFSPSSLSPLSPLQTATSSVQEHVDAVPIEAEILPDIKSSEPAAHSAHTDTLYDLLEGHLRTMWASRDRNVSAKDRWHFRGSWLALWMALQACASNPAYDIFDGPKADETALLLELLLLTAASAMTSRKAHRVSKMPAAPFEGSRTHVRIDSVFSNAGSGAYETQKPTHSELWCGILMGTSNADQVTSVAEWLLSCVWPGENAGEILDAIGDPSKRLTGADELRVQFRVLLFPSYPSISSPDQTIQY